MRGSIDAKEASRTAIELATCELCNDGEQHHENCSNYGLPIDVLRRASPSYTCRKRKCEISPKAFGLVVKNESDSDNEVDVYNSENNYNADENAKFPYDINLLNWDAEHLSNKQHTYCYCGELGEYYSKMLQCHSCLQWFHEKCITSFQFGLFYGDHYYLFMCRVCSGGNEMLSRIEMNMETCVKIALNHLSLSDDLVYFSVTNHILPFIKSNRNCFKLNFDLDSLPDSQVVQQITDILNQLEGELTVSQILKREKLWAMAMHEDREGYVFRPKLKHSKRKYNKNSIKLNRSSKTVDKTMSLQRLVETILLDHQYSMPSPLNSKAESDAIVSSTSDPPDIDTLNVDYSSPIKMSQESANVDGDHVLNCRHTQGETSTLSTGDFEIIFERIPSEENSVESLGNQSENDNSNVMEVNADIYHEWTKAQMKENEAKAKRLYNRIRTNRVHRGRDIPEVLEYDIELNPVSGEPMATKNKKRQLLKEGSQLESSNDPPNKRKRLIRDVKNICDIDLNSNIDLTINEVSKMSSEKMDVEKLQVDPIEELTWKQKKLKREMRKLPFVDLFITNTFPTTDDFDAENNPFYKEIEWKFCEVNELPQIVSGVKKRNRRFHNCTSNRYNHRQEVNKIHRNLTEAAAFQVTREMCCKQRWIRGAITNRRWLARRIAHQTQLDYLYESDLE